MTLDRDGWLKDGEKVMVLWTLRSSTGQLMPCVVSTHPIGPELKVFRGEELYRSEVFRDPEMLLERAREWRAKLEAKGWTDEKGGA